MGTTTYCASCDGETTRIGFNCLKCETTHCEQCVGKAKDYGEGVKEFRCPVCGSNSLFFALPLPVNRLERLTSTKSTKRSFHPNKRASRPVVTNPPPKGRGFPGGVVKRGRKEDDS